MGLVDGERLGEEEGLIDGETLGSALGDKVGLFVGESSLPRVVDLDGV